MIRRTSFFAFAPLVLGLSLALPAHADDGSVTLTLKNHRFEPDVIEIAAQRKVKLVIKNMDASAEEFDSDDLHREKLIPAGKEAVINIGPLKPGSYKFKGEYNASTATGTIVVK